MDAIRVTLRVPRRVAHQMDVRARMYGRSTNEEYVRALETWCAGMEWVETLLPTADLHQWTTDEEIMRAQISPIVVERPERAGRPIGVVLRGRTITLLREWFVADRAFEEARKRLADGNVPLISAAGAQMDPVPISEKVATYGYLGRPKL